MRYIVGALTATVAVSGPYFAVSLVSSHIKQLTKNFIVFSLHNSVMLLVVYLECNFYSPILGLENYWSPVVTMHVSSMSKCKM